MFTKISESKWLKIILFITTFAFVGTGFVALIVYKISGNINGVAQVNGKDISFQEFFFEVNTITAFLESQGIDTAPLKQQIYSQVLQKVVNRELLNQFAEEEGIVATPEEAKKAISKMEVFQTDGKFDYSKYQTFLSRFNVSPVFFTELMMRELTVQHVSNIVKSGIYITDEEINKVLNKYFQRISGKIFIIQPKVSVSEKDLKDYYEKHKNEFIKEKQKEIAIYEFNTKDEDAIKQAQELFKLLKTGKKPEKKPVFSGFENQIKGFPDKVKKEAKAINKENKIKLVKTKDKIYLIVYAGEKSKFKTFEDAKNEIKAKLERKLISKKLEEILKSLSREKLSEKVLKEKFNAKEIKLENETLRNIQFSYGLKEEDLTNIRNTNVNNLSKPIKSGDKIVIIKVDDKKHISKELKDKFKDIKPILLDQKYNDVFSMLLDKLQKEANIKINEQVFRINFTFNPL